ncbi:hypothetical protein CDCA_CDCA15G3942 [Cyanidium caldarium]|uniref:Aldehyde dehydrogenase domain-containing protein n=1 Tax=Cyanidium caldarium TaxID=2771 RepID=A0AAV9J002_CYACA|nr:hypothetical protein CDCA_CDCA15G3942 [Cyanidium caldarium]
MPLVFTSAGTCLATLSPLRFGSLAVPSPLILSLICLLPLLLLFMHRLFYTSRTRHVQVSLPPADAARCWVLPPVYGFGDMDEFIFEDPSSPLFAGGYLSCRAAADGATLGKVPRMQADDVRVRVEAARVAQRTWQHSSFRERRAVMRELHQVIMRHRADIVAASVRETGKTALDAQLGELLTTLEKLRWIRRYGARLLAPEYRPVGPMTLHKRAWVQYEPLGVIGAVAPWNYPFHNLMNPLIAALFAGNAIVIKCSEYSSWCSVYFARLVRETLAACGHPPELVQLVSGDGAAGNALVTDEGIDKVFFTGSTAVGRRVAAAAASRLLPVVLELGGKDAMIVCADCDLEQVCPIALRGVFQNSGQNCVGVERIFVERPLYSQLVERLAEAVRALRIGADVGAMTMGAAALQHIEALVQDAVRCGAKLLVGGRRCSPHHFQPTVLSEVPLQARILREEVFGPVMVLLPFDSDETLSDAVNACPFGLGASVFTRNRARAWRLTRAIRVGMVNVNDFGVNYLCQSLPFGGAKASGSDRFAGAEGLRGCCLMKSVTADRWPGWLRTRIPAPLQYPVPAQATAFMDALLRLIYTGEAGVSGRVRALRDLIAAAVAATGRAVSSPERDPKKPKAP